MSDINNDKEIYINGEKWYTYQQLCRKLGIAKTSLYNKVNTGEIEKISVDGCTFYREVENG